METKSNKQKKRENTKLDLEQYKIMIEIYNEEVTRFYNRQNIYIKFQEEKE